MFPYMLVAGAVVFIALTALVVVPPLYLYDPEQHANEWSGRPSSEATTEGHGMSHLVQQRIYILFMLPFCACLNTLYWYVTYYRHLRRVQLRLELCCIFQSNFKTTAVVLLRRCKLLGIETHESEHGIGKLLSTVYDTTPNACAWPAQGCASVPVSWGNRQRAGMEDCSRHAFLTVPFFPELRKLQDVTFFSFIRRSDSAYSKALEILNKNVLERMEREKGMPEGSMLNAFLSLIERREQLSALVVAQYLKRAEAEACKHAWEH
ncbi:hypothetical protein ERJ75_000462300 [Trypanosoma vivax]|nr:hypothetical protein ERJ75_000462300 [Trypanosoma vivax]